MYTVPSRPMAGQEETGAPVVKVHLRSPGSPLCADRTRVTATAATNSEVLTRRRDPCGEPASRACARGRPPASGGCTGRFSRTVETTAATAISDFITRLHDRPSVRALASSSSRRFRSGPPGCCTRLLSQLHANPLHGEVKERESRGHVRFARRFTGSGLFLSDLLSGHEPDQERRHPAVRDSWGDTARESSHRFSQGKAMGS